MAHVVKYDAHVYHASPADAFYLYQSIRNETIHVSITGSLRMGDNGGASRVLCVADLCPVTNDDCFLVPPQ